MPSMHESSDVSGHITSAASEELGVPQGTPVVGGGGDQAAGAVGNGIVRPGIISVTVGTSGVVFAHMESMESQPDPRLHTFCHAVRGRWHSMGVTLAAGGSMQWIRNTLCSEEWAVADRLGEDPYELMTAEAATVRAGAEGLMFLPYLAGERTPHADPDARGVFFGLSPRHTKAHIIRAVMEGVAFSLLDCYALMEHTVAPTVEIRASGGGARSRLWRQIFADVFDSRITSTNAVERPAYGAAILGAVGVGRFPEVPAACDEWVRVTDQVEPDGDSVSAYSEWYQVYRDLYPALRQQFSRSQEVLRIQG